MSFIQSMRSNCQSMYRMAGDYLKSPPVKTSLTKLACATLALTSGYFTYTATKDAVNSLNLEESVPPMNHITRGAGIMGGVAAAVTVTTMGSFTGFLLSVGVVPLFSVIGLLQLGVGPTTGALMAFTAGKTVFKHSKQLAGVPVTDWLDRLETRILLEGPFWALVGVAGALEGGYRVFKGACSAYTAFQNVFKNNQQQINDLARPAPALQVEVPPAAVENLPLLEAPDADLEPGLEVVAEAPMIPYESPNLEGVFNDVDAVENPESEGVPENPEVLGAGREGIVEGALENRAALISPPGGAPLLRY